MVRSLPRLGFDDHFLAFLFRYGNSQLLLLPLLLLFSYSSVRLYISTSWMHVDLSAYRGTPSASVGLCMSGQRWRSSAASLSLSPSIIYTCIGRRELPLCRTARNG